MNPWRWVDPRVRDVHVADIQGYLLNRGWKLRSSPNPDTLIFELSSGKNKQPFLQALPAHENFSDYPRHIAEFLTTLSEVEDRHPVELLEDILGQSTERRKDRHPRGHQSSPTTPEASPGSLSSRKKTRPA